ncbi:MAG: DUF3810 domain-containing protein [Clostridiales bacterium]|nr:DUF3810 domain-containing protein [Clostridiales bacterium]
MKKRLLFTLVYCLATLLTTTVLLALARGNAVFAEWYASHIFPLFTHTLGRLFSLFPFSVGEMLLINVVIGLLAMLIYSLTMLVRSAASRALLFRLSLRLIPAFGAFCCSLLLIFTLSFGINYSRAPLAHSLGIELYPSSTQELKKLFFLLCEETAALGAGIQLDGEGYFLPLEQPSQPSLKAMRELGGKYPLFSAYYPKPKPVLFSTVMSYLQLAGIYSPFTCEANYNRHMPPDDLPFSICHELAHQNGFAREDEANFVAYLACVESANNDLAYSGLLNALSYVLNALYKDIDGAEYRIIVACLPPQALKDMQRNARFWQKYAGSAANFSAQVNDHYLKANNQADGVKSYGRMVDLLLAYYRQEV